MNTTILIRNSSGCSMGVFRITVAGLKWGLGRFAVPFGIDLSRELARIAKRRGVEVVCGKRYIPRWWISNYPV
jgi:hypothetical protein